MIRYYSTRDSSVGVSFSEAALRGLAPDGGLFVPDDIPRLPTSVLSSLGSMDFRDLAFEAARPFVAPDIPQSVLADLVADAYPFGAPMVPVGGRFVLELFHGPTAAFKDYGARFMARAFSYLRRGEDRPLRILVATSGDTGGAVADGFYGVEGIEVTVLYPAGRVSPLQERQIAGLGGNVDAIAVRGSFDDCQRLVKAAFADAGLARTLDLSSANSINIARLVPQSFYYLRAAGLAAAGSFDADGEATPRRPDAPRPARVPVGAPVVCVPSGNFGNLTAGLYASLMGAPIARFVAATNANRTVPEFLASGRYVPRASVPTVSTAMDVGAPSNFERLIERWPDEALRELLLGGSADDEQTRACIASVEKRHGYVLDPHGAVGWHVLDTLEASGALPAGAPIVTLATAHPAKFTEIVEPIVGPVAIPASLKAAAERAISAMPMDADEDAFFEYLKALA